MIDNSCPICLDNISINSVSVNHKNKCVLGCGHKFHCDCITEWMKNSNTCPMCREKITIKESEVDVISLEQINHTNENSTQTLSKSTQVSIFMLLFMLIIPFPFFGYFYTFNYQYIVNSIEIINSHNCSNLYNMTNNDCHSLKMIPLSFIVLGTISYFIIHLVYIIIFYNAKINPSILRKDITIIPFILIDIIYILCILLYYFIDLYSKINIISRYYEDFNYKVYINFMVSVVMLYFVLISYNVSYLMISKKYVKYVLC